MTDFDWSLINEPDRNWRRLFLLGWAAAGLIVVLIAAFTSWYTVDTDEQAVVLRFGRYHETTEAGFHGKLPFGIDSVLKEKVLTVKSEEFGYRTVSAGVKSQFVYRERRLQDVSRMLTGDLNLAMVNWEIRYRISNLKDYLFNVRNVPGTLRDVSEAIMRTEVGDRSVDEVLTLERIRIETACAERMQSRLDTLKCGVRVVKVNLKRVDPPEEVREAFNAVNKAIQVRDRIINEAEGEVNRKIPAARGAAEKLKKEAEGYKVGRINRAQGDAQAFLSVLEEYKKAEDVTRRRLFLETLEKLLPEIGELILVDGDESGVLKILDLKAGKGGGR